VDDVEVEVDVWAAEKGGEEKGELLLLCWGRWYDEVVVLTTPLADMEMERDEADVERVNGDEAADGDDVDVPSIEGERPAGFVRGGQSE
jgi:hypothetical protein